MQVKDLEIIPHVDHSKNARDHGASAKYKGEDCKVVDYSGPLARRSNGFNLILQDLELCLQYTNLPYDQPAVIQSAIHRALVITYGKCFAKADGRGTKLEARDVFKDTDPKLVAYHDLLIKTRNDFVAHSGSDDFEDSHVKVVLPPESEPGLQPCMLHAARSLRNFSPQNMRFVVQTIEHVKSYTEERLKQCGELIKKQVLSELE